jgi:hypothetical protein
VSSSAKVSADMFGLGLRTYRRKIQRLSESSTERGRSLWEVVLEFIRERGSVTRSDVLVRFSLDEEAQVRSVLRDLCESQLVQAEGTRKVVYRAASADELQALRTSAASEGQDELLVALMYREGPLTLAEIAMRAQTDEGLIETPVLRLVEQGRVQRAVEGEITRYEARALVIPIGAVAGWEGAVFDHFKAVTKTILARLDSQGTTRLEDSVGGSTYTIDIWDGHPLADEVRGTLGQMRSTLSDLRQRVSQYNEAHKLPDDHERVVIYAGQSMVQEGADE